MSVHDQLLAIADRCAQEIVALPPEQRDERYADMRVEHLAKAGALGLPHDAAQELTDQMEATIRRKVAAIEDGTATA
jgi:hypothetical protein